MFSELSEKSLALASSIKQEDSKVLIVFGGVVLADTQPSAELIARAKRIGALLFKDDIVTMPLLCYPLHTVRRRLGGARRAIMGELPRLASQMVTIGKWHTASARSLMAVSSIAVFKRCLCLPARDQHLG